MGIKSAMSIIDEYEKCHEYQKCHEYYEYH